MKFPDDAGSADSDSLKIHHCAEFAGEITTGVWLDRQHVCVCVRGGDAELVLRLTPTQADALLFEILAAIHTLKENQ